MQIGSASSIQGMQRAGERLDRAATSIASPAPATARGSDPSPAPPSGNQGLTAAQVSGDIESAMMEVTLARRAYEANAEALRRNAETAREMLRRQA